MGEGRCYRVGANEKILVSEISFCVGGHDPVTYISLVPFNCLSGVLSGRNIALLSGCISFATPDARADLLNLSFKCLLSKA